MSVNLFSLLPDEMMYSIISQVEQAKAVYTMMRLDKRTYQYIENNHPLWQALVEKHFPDHAQMISGVNLVPMQLYRRLITTENHVGQNKHHMFTLKCNGWIRGVSSFGNKLVSSSISDVTHHTKEIKVIDMENGKTLDNWITISHYIHDVYLYQDKLAVSDEETLNVFNINNNVKELQCKIALDLLPLLIHEDKLFCLSSSGDIIYILDANEEKLINSIYLNPAWFGRVNKDYKLKSVNVFNGKIFVCIIPYACRYNMIIVNGSQIKSILIPDYSPYTVCQIGDEIFCGCQNGAIAVLDLDGKLKRTIKTEFATIHQMFKFGRMLILCSKNGKVEVFDLTKEKIVQIIRPEDENDPNDVRNVNTTFFSMSNGRLFVWKASRNYIDVYDFGGVNEGKQLNQTG